MSRNFALILVFLLAVSAPDMSVKDVAEYFSVTTRTVYKMVADRRLRAYKLGRIIRFRRSEIDAALQPVDAATEPVANIPPKTQRRGPVPRRRDESEFATAPR